MTIRGSERFARTSKPTVTRLAWIIQDLDALMLLRRPLLAAVVQRGHKVIVLAPGLTASHRLSLLAAGIDSEPLAIVGGLKGLFSARASRRAFAQTLQEWHANAAMIDSAGLADDAVRACRDAAISEIYALLPAFETTDAVASMPKVWRLAIESAAAVFVATPNDGRLLAATLGATAPPLHVLSPLGADCEPATARPLPALDAGLVFLGLGLGNGGRSAANRFKPSFAAAVRKLDGRVARARFRLGDIAGASLPMALPGASQAARIDRFELDMTDRAALQAAVGQAHVVVIDGAQPAHLALLSYAFAMGRPVLAIETAVTRDFIGAGADGWCVPASSAPALADAIVEILKRPDLLVGMARAASKKAVRRLGPDGAVKSLFEGLGLADLGVRAA